MKQHLQMDWIDAIFIALGFAIGIFLGTYFPDLSEISSELTVVAVFLAPTLRRAILGPPKLSTPKEGALWKFCSMLGLIAVFFSIPFFWVGALAMQQSKEPMPDFRAEVLKEEAEMDKKFTNIDSFLDSVVVPAGTPQEEIDRLTKENKEKRLAEKLQKREGTIKQREKDFVFEKEVRFQDGVRSILWGLGGCLFGAFLLRIRYPFSKEELVESGSNDE